MDCSFTLLEGVLGCCMVGMVPPCGLSGISDWILLSGFAECATWEEFRPAAEEVGAVDSVCSRLFNLTSDDFVCIRSVTYC